MSKLGAGIYFVMILSAIGIGAYMQSYVPTVVSLGSIIYLSVTRERKTSAAKTAFSTHVAEVKQWLNANA